MARHRIVTAGVGRTIRPSGGTVPAGIFPVVLNPRREQTRYDAAPLKGIPNHHRLSVKCGRWEEHVPTVAGKCQRGRTLNGTLKSKYFEAFHLADASGCYHKGDISCRSSPMKR